MANVLILGAHGKIAQLVETQLLAETDHHLTLFLRNADRLNVTDSKRETVIEGDAADKGELIKALDGIDIVYANLSGKILRIKQKQLSPPLIGLMFND